MNALRWVVVLFVLELAASAVFCGGCYTPPTLPLGHALPVRAAEHAFRELGHEPGNALAGFHVYWAKDEGEFRRLCLGTPTADAAECASQKTTLGGKAYPRAVLRPGQPVYDPDGCSVVSHSAIHWLIAKLRLAPGTPWGMGVHKPPFFGRSTEGTAEQLACEWLKAQRHT